MRRVWLAVAALALALPACGADKPSRFDLRTPEANTGAPLPPTPIPPPVPAETPTPTPTPTPKAPPKPGTKTEKAGIPGGSEELRHGGVRPATRSFGVPSLVSTGDPDWIPLISRAAVQNFTRALRCGEKLIRSRRGSDGFVV